MSAPKILVVGAGPSGLMMAHELARFGVPVQIIDKDLRKSVYSRAIGVQSRTQEIFAALGLYEKLVSKSREIEKFEVQINNLPKLVVPFGGLDLKFPRPLIIDQPHTELVIEQELEQKYNIKPDRGVELVGLQEHTNYIRATLKNNLGEIKTQNFLYIIGADGAHSFVRKHMGIKFSGKRYEESFILADITCEGMPDNNSIRLYFKKNLFLAFFPMCNKNYYRILTVRREGKISNKEPNIKEFQDLAAKIVSHNIEISDPRWVSQFALSCRSCEKYSARNFFLVGDAAHIHSPAGGQGMNTGLQDAFNLGFKLAMVIKNQAHPNLLDSYDQERRPVGEFLINNTDKLFRLLVSTKFFMKLARGLFFPLLKIFTNFRKKFYIMNSQTNIKYKLGAICTCKNHENIMGIKAGKRIENFKIISKLKKEDYLYNYLKNLKFAVFVILPSNNYESKLNIKFVTNYFQTKFGHNIHAEEICFYNLNIDSALLLVVRPDHHVFCFTDLTNYQETVLNLERFLLTT